LVAVVVNPLQILGVALVVCDLGALVADGVDPYDNEPVAVFVGVNVVDIVTVGEFVGYPLFVVEIVFDVVLVAV
jgi:hypothetical protein